MITIYKRYPAFQDLEENAYFYIVKSDKVLRDGSLLHTEFEQKASHQLRKMYFLLIEHAFSDKNRFNVLKIEQCEIMMSMIEKFEGYPTYNSFRVNILEIYRKFIEETLNHKIGVSDKSVNTKKLSDLYDITYAHFMDCGINLENFWEV